MGGVSGRGTNRRLPGRLITRFGFAHGLMVVAGLLTFVTVSSALADRSATASIWIVGRDLPAGAEVTVADVRAVEVPASSPVLDHLVDAGTVPSGRTVRAISGGEPLLRTDLVGAGLVATGRQLSIEIDRVHLDGLRLRVGDRVDLVGVTADESIGFVVDDLPVVARSDSSAASAFGAATRTGWLTLDVAEVEAVAIAAAQQRGPLTPVRSSGAEPLDPIGGHP